MKLKSFLMSGLVAATLSLTACGPDTDASSNVSSTDKPSATVFIDHIKGRTEVPAHPQRAIVFDTTLLDSFAVLGIDVIGVPQPNIAYPEALAQYKDDKYLNAGTLQEPNFEVISAANPDIIFGSGRSERAYDELSAIAPTIMLSVDYTNYIASLRETTVTAAKLFDKEAQANAEFDKLEANIASTKEKAVTAGTAVFVMVNGGKIAAYGPGSRFGFVFDVLGMTPAATFDKQGNHGNVVSLEFLLETNPDWIFVLDRETAIGETQANAAAIQVMNNELVHRTQAYQNDRIIYLDSSSLYLAGGLKTYQDFVRTIDEAISR